MSDPLIDVNTNLVGTINLLEECVKANVKRIIFASSGGAVYGNQDKEIYKEEDATDPISPYAISKLTIEKYLRYYKIHYELDYLILRYANPYGPGQNIVGSQGIIPIFLNLIKNDKPITIFGDGKNVRDYIYIDDLINITKLLFSKKNKYSVYNVGSGEGNSINEVISIIRRITKKNVFIENKQARLIDIKKIILDSKRSNKETNYVLKTSLEKGIQKTWNWINNKS